MSDKPEEAPNEGSGEGTATAGQAGTSAPAPEPQTETLEQMRERLSAAERRASESETNYANLRSWATRTLNEQRQGSQQVAQQSQTETDDPYAPAIQQMGGQMEELRRETGLTRWRAETKDADRMWPRVQEVAGDPYLSERFTALGTDGQIDYYKTLSNITMYLENQDYHNSQAESSAQRAKAEASRKKQLDQATISGQAAYSGEGGAPAITEKDIAAARKQGSKGLTELMEKMGLVDTTNPPRFD